MELAVPLFIFTILCCTLLSKLGDFDELFRDGSSSFGTERSVSLSRLRRGAYWVNP